MSRKKGGHDEEHENHEAWVIPYADMLTLLMVMFLALYAMGNLDLAKFKKLAEAFNASMGGGKAAGVVDSGVLETNPGESVVVGGAGVLEGGGLGTTQQAIKTWPLSNIVGELTASDERSAAKQALDDQRERAAEQEATDRTLREVAQGVSDSLDDAGLGDRAQVTTGSGSITIRLLSDQILFAPGSADLSPLSAEALAPLVESLRAAEGTIEIVGHTDDRGSERDNLLLSTSRAFSVAEALRAQGITDVSVRGAGESEPIADNATPEGRAQNRRVEITVRAAGSGPGTGTGAPPAVPGTGPILGVPLPSAVTPTTSTTRAPSSPATGSRVPQGFLDAPLDQVATTPGNAGDDGNG